MAGTVVVVVVGVFALGVVVVAVFAGVVVVEVLGVVVGVFVCVAVAVVAVVEGTVTTYLTESGAPTSSTSVLFTIETL